jgi:hypothetical protein
VIRHGAPRLARRPSRLALAAAVTLLVALLLSACGGIKAPDLFIVKRSGSGASAKLTLIVNEEGGVTCNGAIGKGGRKLKLSDPQLVEARAIQEDIQEPAANHASLAPGAKSVLSYYLRDENGWVRFSDDSAGQPKVFRQLALFVLRAAQQVCGLPE